MIAQTFDRDQLHFDIQEQCATERRIEGETDGAFGYRPRYADEDYLLGYCYGIKFLVTDANGLIQYP